jgi:RecA-family ATPase
LAVSTNTLPVVRASELDVQLQEQHWLIDGLWARSAIGLIGGPPKCCKTWMGLDMAVSVASGTAALGHFACKAPGTALVYLAEDALPQVRSRIEALCRSRGRDIASLDLHVITVPVLRLDIGEDQVRLARTIEQLRPRLVLLDPLVRLHRLDENSAAEISGLLGYIRDLQRRFDVAIVLVHHASKKQRSQPGQALRGSSDLHAIGDCNAYLARDGQRIALTIEHRAAPSPEPMLVDLVTDASAETACLRVVAPPSPLALQPTLGEQIIELLAVATEPLTRAALRSALRVNNLRLGDALERLERSSHIERTPQGWSLRST